MAAASRVATTALCRAAAAQQQLHRAAGRWGPRLRGLPLAAAASGHQRRWAQVHDVRFAATTSEGRVAEKYREKLDAKARREGHGSVEELREAYRGRIEEQRKREGPESVPGLEALLGDEDPAHEAQRQGSRAAGGEQPKQRSGDKGNKIPPLGSLLDLEQVRGLTGEQLAEVWRARHATPATALCAAVPAGAWMAVEATARAHPTFVLPVPRKDVGAEMHFLQWVFDAESRTSTVLFTQLAEYKARGEFAQPHTSATHYWDEGIAREQGLVLMSGSLVEGRGAAVPDAQWLVMLTQKFYGADAVTGADAGKRALLSEFARGDPGFSVERLLEESEKLA